jgi:hypothetical protein
MTTQLTLTAADMMRSREEAMTIKLMAPVFADLTSGSALCAVARFFEQHYAGAYSADKVVAVLNAYYGTDWNDSIRAGLTKLVRMKALRTRRASGATVYEVNY